MQRVTLASGSPRRQVLLGFLVDDFDVVSPDVDETMPPGDIGTAMQAVAARKAEAVQGDVVIAADTAVVTDQILGKPADAAEARRMLEQLQTPHRVMTAVALRVGDSMTTFCETTGVSMRLDDAALDAYLASGNWQGKAGAYGIQDAGIAPHVRIEGSWSNVVGLPLAPLHQALVAAGVSCRQPPDEADLMSQNPF